MPMTQTTFAPGSVIAVRNRLWRVDGGETRQVTFYVPVEVIEPRGSRPPFTQNEAHRAQPHSVLEGSTYEVNAARGEVSGCPRYSGSRAIQ
jgi:hypothetical protein